MLSKNRFSETYDSRPEQGGLLASTLPASEGEIRMRLEALVGGAAEVVGAETTLSMAAAAMVERAVGALAVVDRRELVGIITERDIVEALAQEADPDTATVAAWMTEAPDTFSPDVSVEEAAEWLLETGYRHLPVMSEGELLGVVSIRDILWAVTQTD